MYESDLKFYRSWKKRYQATLSDFIQTKKDSTSGLANEGGPVKIDTSSSDFMHIWPTLVFLINSIHGKMRQTMKRFGSSESDGFSPFIWHCITGDITELRDKFLKYLSSTFEYDGIKLV